MNVNQTRSELITTLEEILGLQRRLLAATRNPRVEVPDLVGQVSAIERLDRRRDDLLEELRREASKDLRDARPGRPIRELVLNALTELEWPQNAGFLEEYLWAAHQLHIDSRAFAPLRRDERRAWERATSSRHGYVAPALRADGTANPRWLTSSAWPLERRIVATERTEELFDLQKILALVGRPKAGDDLARPRRATDALLEQYAEQFLDIDPPPVAATQEVALEWRQEVRATARRLVAKLRDEDDQARTAAAQKLATLPESERVWGRGRAS